MPELPEVETIRRQLAPRIAGRTVRDAEILDPLWCSPRAPRELERELAGARIDGVHRRGKYLMVSLEQDRWLVMHLRMTGNLLLVSTGEDRRPHLRVRFALDDGTRLLFVDPRRFGTGAVFESEASLRAYLSERLGLEPLEPEFTAAALTRETAGRRTPVKAFLLDQRRVAGIGNIYADEALFRARIHPLRPTGRLRRAEVERLREAIVASLRAGIDAQGASIDDYRHFNGEQGTMQDEFLVHLREGQPCPSCARPIVKLRVAGRGTYVCERCQPPSRPRKVPPP
ncbi:MAG: bifunctional DNA-formamidopyrimidine glycosylase/DNA-(apurinic or apyrimidinic site) lyase [Solirubrobacterales bacterium]